MCKVQLFWEGHKNLHNLPYAFDIYLVNIKSIWKIAQIFVVFSEKLNFILINNLAPSGVFFLMTPPPTSSFKALMKKIDFAFRP